LLRGRKGDVVFPKGEKHNKKKLRSPPRKRKRKGEPMLSLFPRNEAGRPSFPEISRDERGKKKKGAGGLQWRRKEESRRPVSKLGGKSKGKKNNRVSKKKRKESRFQIREEGVGRGLCPTV